MLSKLYLFKFVSKIGEVGGLASVDAEGLVVDLGDAYEVLVVLRIIVAQVVDVLEVVGIDLAVEDDLVGLHVVGELGDLKGDALLGKQRCGVVIEDFGVRRGGCRYGQYGRRGVSGCIGVARVVGFTRTASNKRGGRDEAEAGVQEEIGRASCRERV